MEKDLEEKLNKIETSIEEIKRGVAANETNILVGFEEAKKERAVIKTRTVIKEKLGVDLF